MEVWPTMRSKLATANFLRTGTVWDANRGRELLTLLGHLGEVTGIAWSPDGSRVATVSSDPDRTAKVWDAGTGRDLLTLRIHQATQVSVSWSPDGRKLATAGNDQTAQVYAIDASLLLRLVRSRITRDLTPDECRRYLNTDRCPPLPSVP
jgi:WD40 repeat protein